LPYDEEGVVRCIESRTGIEHAERTALPLYGHIIYILEIYFRLEIEKS